MTNQEKLQQLFDAALKSQPEDFGTHPVKKRAVPTSQSPAPQAPVPVPGKPLPTPAVMAETPDGGSPDTNRTLSREESDKLGILLDEQLRRRRRRHRMEALVTALVLFAMTGGGLAWFVGDANRVQAFQEAMRDIRSVGDIKAMVASYQESLARISARTGQIDQASLAMGINPADCQDEDPYMESEMREMMGAEGGKTVGARNKQLMEKFGDKAAGNGLEASKGAATGETATADNFDWSP
ncbi:MAG: hypothetical protein MUF86_09680 [Akkermansiaceae bacterium]|jgi:hypothetical protein|nr:hypothetical protein [Akkermansiaceae bacterium]